MTLYSVCANCGHTESQHDMFGCSGRKWHDENSYRCPCPGFVPKVETVPYQRHSDTSRAAAQAIAPSAETIRGRVYEFVVCAGVKGATDEEIQDSLRLNPSTQRPRRIELMERGLVFESGQRRATKSGRQATVWVARELARA